MRDLRLNNQWTNPHGMSKTRFYQVWRGMIKRCTYPKTNGFERYSKISVCDRWMTFNNFRDDMHKSYLEHAAIHGEPDTTIERMEREKGYCPENCKWATKLEQQNNKTTNIYLSYQGETKSLADLCRKYGMNYFVAQKRIESGWSIDKTLETPIKKLRRRGSA